MADPKFIFSRSYILEYSSTLYYCSILDGTATSFWTIRYKSTLGESLLSPIEHNIYMTNIKSKRPLSLRSKIIHQP